jgi:undecaprenyl-diphosphatase
LCLTGILLWLTRGKAASGRNLQNMFWRDALIIGLAQGVAIMPGVSRSGTTIAVALFLGIDRQLAGRFSFLLAIPAILGALMLGLDGDLFQTSLPMALILAGSISAAVVGYLALIVLLRIVKKGQFHRFAPYCWVVGLSALVFSIF